MLQLQATCGLVRVPAAAHSTPAAKHQLQVACCGAATSASTTGELHAIASVFSMAVYTGRRLRNPLNASCLCPDHAVLCSHPCFGCGGAPGSSGTVKCSMGQCSRYWHWGCLTGHPLTKVRACSKLDCLLLLLKELLAP